MTSSEKRDYYDHLFTPDSFYTEHREVSKDVFGTMATEGDSDDLSLPHHKAGIFMDNMQILLKDLDVTEAIDGRTEYMESSSDMSISMDSDSPSSIKETIKVPSGRCLFPSSDTSTILLHSDSDEDDASSLSSFESIDSDRETFLLRNGSLDTVKRNNLPLFHMLNGSINQHKNQTEYHDDIIGTYNIQNKYDHSIATQLFLAGGFTFLSLQEPFASQDTTPDSWKACRKNEVESARLCCWETHHQVIIYDSWKWGGKIISNFSSLYNGRIISLAFEFGNKQRLGIISVYAVAQGNRCNYIHGEDREKTRTTCVYAITELRKKWCKAFPGIFIMVLGDLQETVTVSDIDNLGEYRSSHDRDHGIIASLQDSHISIVRERNLPQQYLTRIGHRGARGIDHILIPNSTDAQTLISNTSIDHNNLGSFHFPSDHKLLQCVFQRRGMNNEERGEDTTKYAYSQVSSIRLQQNGTKAKDLTFDSSQFKGSQRYKDHLALYTKLQNLTADNASSTIHYLDGIDTSIRKLYNSLWKDGIAQGSDGYNNELVHINTRQAAELTEILNVFNLGIRDNMTYLGLISVSDQLSKGASVRNMIRLQHGDFKSFSNLPIATKLRYLRCGIQCKKRRIKKYINALQELQVYLHNNSFSAQHSTTIQINRR